MKSLKQEYKINASLESVWDALVNPKTIKKWGGGPAKMSDKKGSEFSLWGGDIHGTNTKVIKQKLLAQDWMAGKWDEYSQVEFKLSFKNGVTKVVLTQKNIPPHEFSEIADGWVTYYVGEIKKLLEG